MSHHPVRLRQRRKAKIVAAVLSVAALVGCGAELDEYSTLFLINSLEVPKA